MVLNDTVGSSGIFQEIDALCDSDTTSYPIVDKTRRVNSFLEEVVGKLINTDGTWQFDDSNYTTIPTGTTNLVANQASYTFSNEFLDIEEVDVMDINGLYRKVYPIDPQILGDLSWEQYFGTQTGFPLYYDKLATTIKLAPVPVATSVTLTAGLQVRFKRTASLFASTDTNVAPGFASPYHVILAYMAAIPYCMAYKKDRVALYQQKVQALMTELLAFYGNREKDVRKVITSKQIRPFK